MAIEIKMPALSPTMEEGTLAKWLVKEGDSVKSGDLLAEIETDKATMEFEAVDEGVIEKIVIAEGTDGVKVGTVIATLAGESEEAAPAEAPKEEVKPVAATPASTASTSANGGAPAKEGDRVKVSPLARRIAAEKGVQLSALNGSGPNGRVVKADIEGAKPGAVWYDENIPHEAEKLSNIRKTIARRLIEAKQTIPHIYLTVDVQLDTLLKLHGELNKSLEGRDVKLSVNDLLIKALAVALIQTPKCNVTYAGDKLIKYGRADISVAVSTPSGLITPIIRDAANIGLASISTQMKELAERAKEGKLKPEEYQGGTASISNMGMFGIKQFDAVINPPQGMILAVGAGEKRPYIVDDALGVTTVMSATGSFDHRAIDGAGGAELMKVFKALVEAPMGLLA